MITQDLTIPVGGLQMPAYLARPPEETGPHGAVIVLQEVFGVNAEMRRVTDLLAAAGYVGIAINYYHRTHPDLNEEYNEAGVQAGLAAAKSLSRENLRADLAASVDWLNAQPFVRKGNIATWGFCMGGTVAFLSATLPGICGAVSFYGGSIARPMLSGEPEGLAYVDALRAPLLLCFGAKDEGIPVSAIQRIRTELDAHGKAYQLEVYSDVGHAFFRQGTPRAVTQQTGYSDEALAYAVADSWNLVRKFLKDSFSAQLLASASADAHT